MALPPEALLALIAAATLGLVGFNCVDLLRWFFSNGLGGLRCAVSALTTRERVDLDPETLQQLERLESESRRQCALVVTRWVRVAETLNCSTYAIAAFFRVFSSPMVLFLHFLILSLASIAMTFPNVFFQGRGRVLLQIAFVALIAAITVTLQGDPAIVSSPAMVMLGSIVGGALCLRSRIYLASNVVISVCSLAPAVCSSLSAQSGKGALRAVVVVEAMSFLGRIALLYAAEYLIKHGARQEAAALLGKCQEAAVSSLLGNICDVVVELDDELRLKSHSPKLAHLLIHASGRCLQGVALAEFIQTAEERSALVQALAAQRPEGPASGMTTARLRDSMGRPVKVVVHYVQFLSIGGKTHLLVGLQEQVEVVAKAPCVPIFPDAVLQARFAEKLATSPSQSNGPGGRRGAVADGSGRQRTGSSSCSSRRSNETSNQIIIPEAILDGWEQPLPEMSAKVEVRSGLPIAWMGSALRARFGVSPGARLDLGEFLPENGWWLKGWIEETIDDAMDKNYGRDFIERVEEEMTFFRGGIAAEVPGRFLVFIRFLWPPRMPDGRAKPVVVALSTGRRQASAADPPSPLACPKAVPLGRQSL